MSKKKKKHAKTLSIMIPPANEEKPETKKFHISVEGETFKHSWEIEFYVGAYSYSKIREIAEVMHSLINSEVRNEEENALAVDSEEAPF